MVILDPDKIVIFDYVCNVLREDEVCLTIGFPNIFIEMSLPRMVVEQWPRGESWLCAKEGTIVWSY